MASQTFYLNGGIYPYTKLNYLRFNNSGLLQFLRLDRYFDDGAVVGTYKHNKIIINIKLYNESLTTTDNTGWLSIGYLQNAYAVGQNYAHFINNYDSNTNKLEVFSYYTGYSTDTWEHVYIENVNQTDILNKNMEFTITLDWVNHHKNADDPPDLWDITINGKINNAEITPIVLEDIPLIMSNATASELNHGWVLHTPRGKIGKLYSIEIDEVNPSTNVSTLACKFTPCYQKNTNKIILFNELYITPSPAETYTWYWPSTGLYYLTQFGNIAEYTSETYNLQSSDIQWYNWRTSARDGIIIP